MESCDSAENTQVVQGYSPCNLWAAFGELCLSLIWGGPLPMVGSAVCLLTNNKMCPAECRGRKW